MRIGIDGRSLLENEPSGVSIYTSELIRALAYLPATGQAHTWHIFLSGLKWPQQTLAWLNALPNTSVHHLSWPNKVFHTAALLGVAPKLNVICGGVDVWFAPNWHVLPLSADVPLVLTVHDLSYRLYPQFLSWRRKLWHSAVQPERVMRRARQIIAVSQATASSLPQTVSAKSVSIIHSGIPTLPTAEPIPNLPTHYIVCVATLEPRKNLASVLQAFQRYRVSNPNSQLQLVLLGARGWRNRSMQQHLLQSSAVQYLGYITAGQKRYVLERAAALFYPSIYEGFGFPPLEALALGTPVVASNTGALPEILQRSAWYCNPYSIQELTTLLASFDSAPRQHPPYYQADWQQLDWDKTAQATLRVLEQAVY